MNPRAIGWAFVGAQFVLLATLILLPGRDHWPTPGWLSALGLVVVVTGVGLAAVAALRLGPALTPTPMPNDGGLVTGGLYRWVRHPIYSGVLLVVVGLTLPSGSVVTLVVGVITVAFFNFKAAWEERRLAERYPGYEAYRARTGRFIPRPASATR